MGFSEQLKKARTNMGYTQQQVADLMGVDKSTYCGYETGKRQPDVAKIKQLAIILNTSGDILLETGFQENEISEQSDSEEEIMEFYEIFSEIMAEKDMSIADIAKTCNLKDSTVRSIVDRKQKKIALNIAFKLSDGLNVSLERLNGMPEKPSISKFDDLNTLNQTEQQLINEFRNLNKEGQERILNYIDDIADTGKYKKHNQVRMVQEA